MGGMVTRIALSRLPRFNIDQVDSVSNDIRLNEYMLVTIFRWMRYRGNTRLEFTWFVRAGEAYADLPQPGLTGIENSERENPLKFPPAQAVNEPVPPPHFAPPPPPPFHDFPPFQQDPPPTHVDPSGGEITMRSLMDELQRIRWVQERQFQENDFTQTYVRGIYQAQVEAGIIREPYLNYPHHPPQQGPVPGWHESRPTYPYHPPRPEGIDYRFPGGSDPSYDPNYPPWYTYPTYPPEYHSSVPSWDQTWGAAPPPTLRPFPPHPPYPSSYAGMDQAGPSSLPTEDPPSSSTHMDEDD